MDNKQFYDIIERLNQADTIDELHRVCSHYCEENDFDNFIYGARIPTSLIKPYFVFVSSYPDEWRNHYVKSGYIKSDPTVIHCAANSTPINWNDIDKSHQIMLEAREFELNSGLSVPLHTVSGEFAMLSMASRDVYKKSESRITVATPYTQLLIAYIHENVKRIIGLTKLEQATSKLTKREQECLLWIAEGKTTWEVSQILKISERTIVFHLQNASVKLGVVNRQQAVAKAIVKGLIAPQMAT